MKRTIVFALLALAACTPAPTPEPAAAVEGIYKPLADSKGETGTDISTIPMTEDLALKRQEVESKADGSVIDWDLAGNCQDCIGFADIKVGDAWKVDNVETEGFNLRTILDEQLGAQSAAAAEDGEAAVNCMTFIRLESDALPKTTPPGDVNVLDHAFTTW